LNSAVNFRDSQRAYYLARAGIGAFTKYGDQLRQIIPVGEFQPVPGIEENILLKWEDQRGLINVNTAVGNPNVALDWLANLFENKGISTDVLQKIVDLKKERGSFRFVSELRTVMSDEEYTKVAPFLTVDSDGMINMNTASVDVLESVLPDKPQAVSTIVNTRRNRQITSWADVGLDQRTENPAVLNMLAGDSTFFRVYSYATVGDYTKQVEAVFQGGNLTFMKAL
jgi:type II secretory pathway component PulK